MRRTARCVIIASASGMLRPASASAVGGAIRNASEYVEAEFGGSVTLGDPLSEEVLNVRYSSCEFARDEALNRAADQWDFEFHTSLERHPRAVLRRSHQCGAGTGSRRPGHRDVDLSAELTLDRSPRLGMPDFQIAAIELRDYPGHQVAPKVLGGGHPYGLVVIDDQRFQRGAPIHGRKPGQPITLVAERRMNLFDSCGRVGRHIERTRHSNRTPYSLPSNRSARRAANVRVCPNCSGCTLVGGMRRPRYLWRYSPEPR